MGEANFLTVGDLARRGGWDIHRVEYILRKRKIKPAFKAGSAFVYGVAAFERVRTELKAIESARARRQSL